ncbi:MAG: ABC transporter permease [Actinomycetota bacterium]|nr:ABC transporter permease [Actinomycetota bacterium]
MRPAAVLCLWQRELLEGQRRWTALVLDLAFGALNLIVFFFIARSVGRPSRQLLDGAPGYFAFAAVGIALMLVVQSAAGQQVSRVRREQLTGTLEAVVAQPVSLAELAFGLTGAGYLLAAVRALLYLTFAVLALGLDASRADALGVVVIVVLACVSFMAVAIALLALALVVRGGESLVRVMLVAMVFLSGAYFPVARLPHALGELARFMPPRIALDGLRRALFRGHGWVLDAGWLALSTAVVLPLSLLALAAALASLKRRAKLTTS